MFLLSVSFDVHLCSVTSLI